MATGADASLSFPISQYPAMSYNAVGLAVNPLSNDICISSIYGLEDNLYRFSNTGQLISSTRVPVYLGSGNLGSLSVGANNDLYAYAAQWTGTKYDHYVLKLNETGTSILSSFSLAGDADITYNELANTLMVVPSIPDASPQITSDCKIYDVIEMTTEGALLNTAQINLPFTKEPFLAYIWDVAFDSLNNSILVAGSDFGRPLNRQFVAQYVRDYAGNYEFIQAYDLDGHITNGMAFDVNRANGMFYFQDNNNFVTGLDRTELETFDLYAPVPLPEPWLLLSGGLAGMAALRTRRRKS